MSYEVGVIGKSEDKSGIRGDLRRLNQRKMEPFPRRTPTKWFYIFNTGPFKWTRALADMGTYQIQPCEDGESYYKQPIVIPEFMFRHYEAGNQQLNYREYQGIDVARDILGILSPSFEIARDTGVEVGPSSNPESDFTRFGVFMSESNPPKKAEVEAAREKLEKTCVDLCQEGDTAWIGDDASRHFIRNSNLHKIAARVIGHEAEWCASPKRKTTCPACGGSVVAGAAIHNAPECGAVLDEAKARKYFPHMFAKEEEKPLKKI